MARLPLRSLFFTPPMAIARLGGSEIPVDAYEWFEDPSDLGGGLTSLKPAQSLRVESDGSVSSFWPTELVFRDGDLLRPVAPFLELWVEYSDGEVRPLSGTLLIELGSSLADVTYQVEAANRKAQRRTGDPSCAFVARVQFDHTAFDPHPLLASSPGPMPLVSPERPIALGSIRAVRPVPAEAADPSGADRDILRLRFTPAKGLVYGPPSADDGVWRYRSGEQVQELRHEIVPVDNRILNEPTPWSTYRRSDPLPHPQPADTYDGSGDPSVSPQDRSWGVVDDTCDVVVTATVRIGDQELVAQGRVFVGPPDYAPDKRPFTSLLDDLLDRVDDAEDLEQEELLAVVADLLKRAFETVSLDDVDLQRGRAIAENLDQGRLNFLLQVADQQGVGDRVRARLGIAGAAQPPLADGRSMTDGDVGYRAPDRYPLREDAPLPRSLLAREAHLALTALPVLRQLLETDGDRVRRLLRPPYAVIRESQPGEATHPEGLRRPWDAEAHLYDMRMPAYMRDSDATPLALTRRQYRQVTDLIDGLAQVRPLELAVPAPARRGRSFRARAPAEATADELFAQFRATDLTVDVPVPVP